MTDQAPTFSARSSATADLEHGRTFMPKFDRDGLIPAIVTDARTGEVLMFAWMNAEALARSIDTRQAWFWSRSRQSFWRKGEDSGNTLDIVEMRTDCDQDAILIRATLTGAGVACHTGARSCFYRSLALGPDAAGNSAAGARSVALSPVSALPKP